MKHTYGTFTKITREEIELIPAEAACLKAEREDETERLTIPQALTATTTLLFQGGGTKRQRCILAAALLLHQAAIEEGTEG